MSACMMKKRLLSFYVSILVLDLNVSCLDVIALVIF